MSKFHNPPRSMLVAFPCCLLSFASRLSTSFLPLVTCLSALVFLSGCCGPSRPTTIPISGTITFNGSPPPAEGAIYFAPITAAEGFDKRPGRARFDTSGKFSVTSFEDGDGLIPGTYSVQIECWKTAATMEAPFSESHVPEGFNAPTLEVPTSGGSQTYNVDVPAQ